MGIFLLAIVIQTVGHWFKSYRWKRIISIYEEVDGINLLETMAIGQGINMILPWRIGDLFRICRTGKKHLDNGYILAFASVVIDLFIDVITVGMAFSSLYLLEIHKDQVETLAVNYGILSIAAIIISLVAILGKKWVKVGISKVAALFNCDIERKMLMTSYTVLSSIKELLHKKNIWRIILCTVCVWGCYFTSYNLLASFLQKIGYEFTLTGVFKTFFSVGSSSMFIEWVKSKNQLTWMIWFLVYLMIPILLILVISCLYKKLGKHKTEKLGRTKILPQLNNADKLAFLNCYFSDEKREYFDRYLEINNDVNVLKDCSAGSNATTILCMKDGKTFYRKYAFGKDADKLWDQIEWIIQYSESLTLPVILKKERTKDYCYYDMQYRSDAISFFNYIHSASDEDNWCVLNAVLEDLDKNLYQKNKKEPDLEALDTYIDSKVIGNIKICNEWCKKYYPDIFNSVRVVINGKEYKNLGEYKYLQNKTYLQNAFSNDLLASIHADLTIENIVCIAGTTEGWYLIDPNTGSLYESSFMDYAKLLQSLHGMYEFLMMVDKVNVSGNKVDFLFTGSVAYRKLYEAYKKFLFERFSTEEVRSIFYHEIIHWLRLMPYKIKKDPARAIVFYSGMLMVLSDVEEMFKDE